MPDQLRDQIPYFRTWLALTDNRIIGWNRDQAGNVKELEEKVKSAKRCLAAAKKMKCYDLMEEFADITIQIQEKVDVAKKKLALINL